MCTLMAYIDLDATQVTITKDIALHGTDAEYTDFLRLILSRCKNVVPAGWMPMLIIKESSMPSTAELQ